VSSKVLFCKTKNCYCNEWIAYIDGFIADVFLRSGAKFEPKEMAVYCPFCGKKLFKKRGGL